MKIGVIGSGQMGSGIAQVCAQNKLEVVLMDKSKDSLKKAKSNIDRRLSKISENIESTTKHLSFTSDLAQISDCSLVIEAIVENLEIKLELFKEIDSLVSQDCIIASNTSSISITKLAASVSTPSRVIGIHFMNPVPVMELVEIIRGLQTDDNTYSKTLQFIKQINKTPVTARKDYPGFIVNRILVPMINEAIFVLMEGVGSAEEIDAAMKLGTNQPMGPLRLADFVGLDTLLSICKILHHELGDDKYRPCPLLVKHVEAGYLGKKVKRGFYQYD